VKKIIAPTALALAGGVLVAPPATADQVGGATLTWKVSECAFDTALPACGSLTQTQSVSGSTTKEVDGWRFTGGTGTYDPANGAVDVSFSGGLTIGNTSRGNYSITFANPRITVAGGTGELVADVSYRIAPATEPTTVPDVTVAELPQVPNATAWQVTPPWERGQFAQELLDTLPDSLDGWFKATGSTGANPLKPAAPVSVDLGIWTPTVTMEGADGLPVDKQATITVKGSGFDPSKKGGAVQGLYVVFGPDAATVGYGMDAASVFGAAQFLPVAPDAQGEFSTTLTITGRYTDSDGKAWDGTKQPLGVSTWAAHSHATTAWDTFTPITFAPADKAASRTTLRLKKKSAKRPVAVVRVPGATGKVVVKKGSRTLVRKRLNDGKAVMRLPKLKAGKHKLRAVYLGNDATAGSTSKRVVLRVR